jgi:hypothetical protein
MDNIKNHIGATGCEDIRGTGSTLSPMAGICNGDNEPSSSVTPTNLIG